jgi:hypothetical protein
VKSRTEGLELDDDEYRLASHGILGFAVSVRVSPLKGGQSAILDA